MTTQLLIRILLPVIMLAGLGLIAWVRAHRSAPRRACPLGWLDDDGLVRGARWDGGPLAV
jgi:hypothetical protein